MVDIYIKDTMEYMDIATTLIIFDNKLDKSKFEFVKNKLYHNRNRWFHMNNLRTYYQYIPGCITIQNTENPPSFHALQKH